MARSKFELRAQKELESDGWLVDWKIRPSGRKMPRGYAVDYWNLFDLLAYQGKIIRAIAIKGQAGVPSKLRKAIEEFDVCEHFVKEIWTYRRLSGKGKDKRKVYCKQEIIE